MPIQKTTYKDHVIKYIYDDMRENRFRPGEKILESHLAKELRISRAPIREALADMVKGGLLEYRPQIGNFVASLTPKEIIDSYIARGILEGFAVSEGLESFTDEELSRLEEMAHRMEVLAERDQHKALIDLGQEFHEELFNRCTNSQVVLFTEQLSLKLHLLFYKHWASVYTPGEIRDRHLKIIAMIRKKDAVKLELLIPQHYIATVHKIIKQDADRRPNAETNTEQLEI